MTHPHHKLHHNHNIMQKHTKAPPFGRLYFQNKISLLIQWNQIVSSVWGTVCLVLDAAMGGV